jgi:methylated-DNA-[protein]-cysteine S-methyltransferase
MIHSFDTWTTSWGPFSAAADAGGAIVATAFGDQTSLARRLPGASWSRAPEPFAVLQGQLEAYLRGTRRSFTLATAARGSVFQQRVWAALAAIPYGHTCSYGDMAQRLGSSPRAVGRANATNPLCVLVPCHRVIGADGSLTGFAFGEEIKRRLLELEAQHADTRAA